MRRDMYSRYVQTLVDLHTNLHNFEEAAATNLQQIKILTWDNSKANLMQPLGDYPAEAEAARKVCFIRLPEPLQPTTTEEELRDSTKISCVLLVPGLFIHCTFG